MVKLKYKSLVTKETIDYYLSVIKNENVKKNFQSTISKFDIRITTEPIIKGLEFYCKIWTLKRGTKKRAHIKQYYPLKLIDDDSFKTIPLSLRDILSMIRLNADVPDDFEEYCEYGLEMHQMRRIEFIMSKIYGEQEGLKNLSLKKKLDLFPFCLMRMKKMNI